MSLLSELRRRHVHRKAALYAAAAWLVMQVVDVVEGKLPLPDWMGSAVLAVLAAAPINHRRKLIFGGLSWRRSFSN